MKKENILIRNRLKEVNRPIHWLAHIVGVSEPTITRWLRYELPIEKQKEIICLIDSKVGDENAECD